MNLLLNIDLGSYSKRELVALCYKYPEYSARIYQYLLREIEKSVEGIEKEIGGMVEK